MSAKISISLEYTKNLKKARIHEFDFMGIEGMIQPNDNLIEFISLKVSRFKKIFNLILIFFNFSFNLRTFSIWAFMIK